MRTEALRMSAEQFDLIFDRSLDHLLRFPQRNRHWLLDHDVLARVGGRDRMGSVETIRRGDPNRFHVGIGAEFVDAVIGFRAKALPKCFQHPRIDIRRRDQLKF
jgi:hypothetical protein